MRAAPPHSRPRHRERRSAGQLADVELALAQHDTIAPTGFDLDFDMGAVGTFGCIAKLQGDSFGVRRALDFLREQPRAVDDLLSRITDSRDVVGWSCIPSERYLVSISLTILPCRTSRP